MIRFNKNLENFDYPLTQQQIDLVENSSSVGLRLATDPRVLVLPTELPTPTYPEDGIDFWSELYDVVRATSLSKKSVKFDSNTDHYDNVDWFKINSNILIPGKPFVSETIKKIYGVKYTGQGAELVHADFPTDILTNLAKNLMSQGAKLRKILPNVEYKRFTDGVVMLGHSIGWAVHTVSPSAFAAKWHFGRPRPEEVIHNFCNGQYDVPEVIARALDECLDMDKVKLNAANFTMYPEGAPMHPAYPAMHGAAAGAGVLFNVLFDLTDNQKDEVRRTMANIALFRDFAGVHYKSDSLVGLELGEMVMIKALPSFLANYGADPVEVAAIAQAERSNWLQ